MDLWNIFVLSQVRLCLNFSYDVLHDLANNRHNMGCLMGVEKGFGYERIEFEYQNIYDNVTLLSRIKKSRMVTEKMAYHA